MVGFHTSPTQMITAEERAVWYSMVLDTIVMKESLFVNQLVEEEECAASGRFFTNLKL